MWSVTATHQRAMIVSEMEDTRSVHNTLEIDDTDNTDSLENLRDHTYTITHCATLIIEKCSVDADQ